MRATAHLRVGHQFQRFAINTVLRPQKQLNQKCHISNQPNTYNIKSSTHSTNFSKQWASPFLFANLFHQTPCLRAEGKEELEAQIKEQIDKIHLKFMELGEQATYMSQMGKNQQALQKYAEMKKYISKFPELFEDKIGGIACAEGLCHAALGQDKEALACFDLALSKQTQDPKMHFARGNILKKMGNLQEALTSYGSGLRLEKDPEIMCEQGDIFCRLGLWEEAINSFENAFKLDDTLEEDWTIQLAVSYNKQGKHEQAIKTANVGLEYEEDTLELYRVKLDSLSKLKKYDALVETAEEALTKYPNNPIFLQHKAVGLSQTGRYTESLAFFEKAAQEEPDQPDVFFNTAVAAFQKNEYATAVTFFEKALERLERITKGQGTQPKHFPMLSGPDISGLVKLSLQNKGVALTQLNRHEEAIQTFKEYLKLHDKYDESPVYFHMVRSLGSLGRHEEALEVCEKRLYSNPTDSRVMALKAQVLIKLGQFEEAIKYFDESLVRNPDDVNLHMGKAAALGKLGRNDDARVHLQRAAQLAKLKKEPMKAPPQFEEFMKMKMKQRNSNS